MKRLTTEAGLQSLVAQFVPIKIDTSTPQFQQWEREHRSGARGIPIIYAVRADGETIYAKSGAPQGDGLPKLLIQFLKQSGTIYSNDQLKVIYEAKQEFEKQLESKDTRAAIDSLKSLKKIGVTGNLGSYAKELIEFDKAIETLVENAKKRITELQTKIIEKQYSDEQAVELMLEYNDVTTAFRGFDPLSDAVKEIQGVLRQDDGLGDLAKDLMVIERAKNANSRSSKQRVLQQLRDINNRSENEHIKTVVSNSIKELQQGLIPEMRTWTDNTGSFSVKARLIDFNQESVTLQKEDGSDIRVPVARLSDEDVRYIKSLKQN